VFLISSGCGGRAGENLETPLALSEVRHTPKSPHSNEAVTITALAPPEILSLSLEYQIVDPGAYIALSDGDFKKGWVTQPMTKSQTDKGTLFKVELPSSLQAHRRMVRYRFRARDDKGVRAAPPENSPEPNFAYFVYDGVPPWRGAIDPKSGDARRRAAVEFPPGVMDQVQNYLLIGKKKDVENATWYQPSSDNEYKYTGSIVANGEVYDHIHFRARGGVWRHAMGKNMWKMDFNKGHHLQARDDYGHPYKEKWAKLNLRACIQQGDYGRRGEQGMYEAVGFRLFNLAGVDAPRTHWISMRIVDEKEETPGDQYRGDFWGLYLAIENEDGHFLKEHNLPDGNLYKMMGGQGELSNQGQGQVTNKSDINGLISAYRRNNQGENWWRANVDLPRYYSYRSIIEAIHHYDVIGGKNYDFYFNPVARKWSAVPWDIDLTWGDQMYGDGNEPWLHPVLSHAAFRLEYQNRLREIRDLLYNPDETDRLIDECAAIIWKPGDGSIVDADRAKWDYHPIMASRYSMRGKADQGLFYRASRTGDFAGMVQQMKDYVRRRCSYIDRNLIADATLPSTPAISYTAREIIPLTG
jgi:hypothetical protein